MHSEKRLLSDPLQRAGRCAARAALLAAALVMTACSVVPQAPVPQSAPAPAGARAPTSKPATGTAPGASSSGGETASAQSNPPAAPPVSPPANPPASMPAAVDNSSVTAAGADKTTGWVESGIASWYGPRFQGKRTASGERFDTNELTAAHKTLPFGTRVRVRSLADGKEVVVRINDRGPFIKGRIIDLSRAAAQAIGMLGVKQVEIERLR